MFFPNTREASQTKSFPDNIGHLFWSNLAQSPTLAQWSFGMKHHTLQWIDILLMVQKSGIHQLRLVNIYHYLQGFKYIPGGCLGFLNHQQCPIQMAVGKMSFLSHWWWDMLFLVPWRVWHATSNKAHLAFRLVNSQLAAFSSYPFGICVYCIQL